MERMERRLQVTICSSLEPITRNVGDLKVRVMAIKERVAPHEEDEQEDDSSLDSGWQRDSPAEPYPAMDRDVMNHTFPNFDRHSHTTSKHINTPFQLSIQPLNCVPTFKTLLILQKAFRTP